MPIDPETGIEIPMEGLPLTDGLPIEEPAESPDRPIWASEEPVDDILSEQAQSSDGFLQAVEKEVLRAEAMVLITNIAPKQSKDVIADLTAKVLDGYKLDLESRKEWEERNKQIIDLAKLLVQKKTYAGEVVANVKYPLIINACIQFAAREIGRAHV